MVATIQARSAPFVLALMLVVSAGTVRTASAHEGPPFPVLLDKPVADYVVSVWADPDIGEAQFFIIVETVDGKIPPNPPRVSLWVQPVNGRLERVIYETEQQPLRHQLQFAAQPSFDQRDIWTVCIEVTPPDGKPEQLTTEVESTPPGYGPWDLVIYLFPFLFLGGLWAFALIRRVRNIRACQSEQQDGPTQEFSHPSTGHCTHQDS